MKSMPRSRIEWRQRTHRRVHAGLSKGASGYCSQSVLRRAFPPASLTAGNGIGLAGLCHLKRLILAFGQDCRRGGLPGACYDFPLFSLSRVCGYLCHISLGSRYSLCPRRRGCVGRRLTTDSGPQMPRGEGRLGRRFKRLHARRSRQLARRCNALAHGAAHPHRLQRLPL
jgi:hypothetical protein